MSALTDFADLLPSDGADLWYVALEAFDLVQPWTGGERDEGRSFGDLNERHYYNVDEPRTPGGHGRLSGRWVKGFPGGGASTPSAPRGQGRPDPRSREERSQSVQPQITAIPEPAPGETPVDVGSDVDLAVRLIGEGKPVNFRQPRQVSILLDRLAKIVDDAKAKGENAPNYNLCQVTLRNTSLFCVNNKGVPRLKMPQLKGVPTKGSPADARPRDKRGEVDLLPDFVASLREKGATIRTDREHASHLLATQNELNGPKVAGIARAIEAGVKIEGPLLVTEDNYIVDGHHRWAAVVGVNARDNDLENDPQMDLIRIGNMDILTVLGEAFKYAEANGLPVVGLDDQRATPADSSPERDALLEEWGQGPGTPERLKAPLPVGPPLTRAERKRFTARHPEHERGAQGPARDLYVSTARHPDNKRVLDALGGALTDRALSSPVSSMTFDELLRERERLIEEIGPPPPIGPGHSASPRPVTPGVRKLRAVLAELAKREATMPGSKESIWDRRMGPAMGPARPKGAARGSGLVGISPARSSRQNLDEIDSYYATPRYQQFEKAVDQAAAANGLSVERKRSVGFWKGDMEPSASVSFVDGDPATVRSFAGAVGRKYQQDSVAVFHSGAGSGARYSIPVRDRQAAIDAIAALGIDGATVTGNEIVLLDPDGSQAAIAAELASVLGATVDVEPGEVSFLEHGRDYEEAVGRRADARGGGEARGEAPREAGEARLGRGRPPARPQVPLI